MFPKSPAKWYEGLEVIEIIARSHSGIDALESPSSLHTIPRVGEKTQGLAL